MIVKAGSLNWILTPPQELPFGSEPVKCYSKEQQQNDILFMFVLCWLFQLINKKTDMLWFCDLFILFSYFYYCYKCYYLITSCSYFIGILYLQGSCARLVYASIQPFKKEIPPPPPPPPPPEGKLRGRLQHLSVRNTTITWITLYWGLQFQSNLERRVFMQSYTFY